MNRNLQLYLGLAVSACAFASTLLLASAAWANPSVATLTLNAPIAARKGATFTARGTASAAVSADETVTVSFERLGKSWSVVSTSAATLDSSRKFSVRLSAAGRGHFRVRAELAATASHSSASAKRSIKIVGTKVIALTFDDGPWPTSTAAIIAALSKNDVQATFFTLGSQVGSRAALLRSELSHGDIVGVHSWNHALMTKRSAKVNAADLTRCKHVVYAATHVTPHWFRPPYGSTNAALRKTAAALGLRHVLWNIDTLDWKYRTKASVVARAMAGARNGGVMLMHDGGGPRSATVAAVPVVIKRLRAKGFDFATLDEMAALGYKIP